MSILWAAGIAGGVFPTTAVVFRGYQVVPQYNRVDEDQSAGVVDEVADVNLEWNPDNPTLAHLDTITDPTLAHLEEAVRVAQAEEEERERSDETILRRWWGTRPWFSRRASSDVGGERAWKNSATFASSVVSIVGSKSRTWRTSVSPSCERTLSSVWRWGGGGEERGGRRNICMNQGVLFHGESFTLLQHSYVVPNFSACSSLHLS